MSQNYLNNPLLKKRGVQLNFTADQVLEYQRCSEDINYFSKNYVKIINVDQGLINFDPYKYQENMLKIFSENRFVITKMPRQSGKTTAVVAYILWKILFNESLNIAILAHKSETAQDILSRIKLAYQYLPTWLQQGVLKWNELSIELENGCKIKAASTSSGTIRGGSYNLIFLDEFAFVPRNIADDFFSSVYPTISSGKTTQVIIVSTPNGMNHFYKMWTDAEKKRSSYVTLAVHWTDVPGRDEAWKAETIANTSEEQFAQEFDCQFLGGSNTLINPNVLKNIPFFDPLSSSDNFQIFSLPEKEHQYVITADCARGLGLDYSSMLVIDITTVPHKVVCKYRSRTIHHTMFPNIICEFAKRYNEAMVLIELNDVGESVAHLLYYDLEYENLFMTNNKERLGESGSQFLGVKTTKKTKKQGCSYLKGLIESYKLEIVDFDIIEELSSFVQMKNSYEAEPGAHDDLVMCLVIFAWLINQEYYKNLTDINIRERIVADNSKKIEEELMPFGSFDDGMSDIDQEYGW